MQIAPQKRAGVHVHDMKMSAGVTKSRPEKGQKGAKSVHKIPL